MFFWSKMACTGVPHIVLHVSCWTRTSGGYFRPSEVRFRGILGQKIIVFSQNYEDIWLGDHIHTLWPSGGIPIGHQKWKWPFPNSQNVYFLCPKRKSETTFIDQRYPQSNRLISEENSLKNHFWQRVSACNLVAVARMCCVMLLLRNCVIWKGVGCWVSSGSAWL